MELNATESYSDCGLPPPPPPIIIIIIIIIISPFLV